MIGCMIFFSDKIEMKNSRGNSRNYIYQAVELPTLGQATLPYLVTSVFATPRNNSIDGFKNTFNIFETYNRPLAAVDSRGSKNFSAVLPGFDSRQES